MGRSNNTCHGVDAVHSGTAFCRVSLCWLGESKELVTGHPHGSHWPLNMSVNCPISFSSRNMDWSKYHNFVKTKHPIENVILEYSPILGHIRIDPKLFHIRNNEIDIQTFAELSKYIQIRYCQKLSQVWKSNKSSAKSPLPGYCRPVAPLTGHQWHFKYRFLGGTYHK